MFICEKDMNCVDCPRNYPYEECAHWIEVKPVLYAHWNYGIQCSNCGQVDTTKPPYCSNCGATMINIGGNN